MGRKKGKKESLEKKEMFKRVGEYLRKKRLKANISQQRVSEEMKLTTAQYVSNIERGISPPSIDFLKLAIILYKLDFKEVAFFLSKEYHNYLLRELSIGK